MTIAPIYVDGNFERNICHVRVRVLMYCGFVLSEFVYVV